MLVRNVATCWGSWLNVGTLEDFTRVIVHVAAGDVWQVDVEAGRHRHGDRQPSSLRPLGGDQSTDSRRLRVENAHIERESVLVERSKQ